MRVGEEELIVLVVFQSGRGIFCALSYQMRQQPQGAAGVQRDEQEWSRCSMHSRPREVTLSAHELQYR